MSVESFIREVDEDLRRDRASALWKRFGPAAIVLAVILVVAVAGWQLFGSWRAGQRVEDARQFTAAEELRTRGQTAEAAAAFAALAEDAATGYGPLARLRAAAALSETGDVAAADQQLSALAADGGAPPALRDLAKLLIDMRAGAAGAVAEGQGPWRYSAQELRAVEQLRQGDRAAARTTYQALADDGTVPPELRRRAREMAAALAPADEPAAAANDPAPAVEAQP